MNHDHLEAFLFERFGSTTLHWLFSADSNALQLAPTKTEPPGATIALGHEQAARIRALGDSPSAIYLEINLAGENLQLYLVGRRDDHARWIGVASSRPEYVPVQAIADLNERRQPANVVHITGRRQQQ